MVYSKLVKGQEMTEALRDASDILNVLIEHKIDKQRTLNAIPAIVLSSLADNNDELDLDEVSQVMSMITYQAMFMAIQLIAQKTGGVEP